MSYFFVKINFIEIFFVINTILFFILIYYSFKSFFGVFGVYCKPIFEYFLPTNAFVKT